MSKKVISLFFIVCIFLAIFWLLFAKPFVHKFKNDTNHSKQLSYFENIVHPIKTEQLYYTDFFGNSSGAGNHCEHLFLEIRSYTAGNEEIIKKYFNSEYPNIRLNFITSIEQCCQTENKYHVFCDYIGLITNDQPFFTIKNWKNKFPIYTLEYSVNGKHMADKRCY
ncbi:hypothetical protein [Aquimarina aquimarini]|uniref:hypothetical protein n=1 Tax=Aquimarina aquimarini TaxID=1191734 RepID=UPI000D5560B6|nr:hypothetical protein [Aquimarina aquimarini]